MLSPITLVENLHFTIFHVVALRQAQNDDAIGHITDWRKHICLCVNTLCVFANFSIERRAARKSTDGREILRSTSLRWFDGFSGSVRRPTSYMRRVH